jgi:transposase InsO family protein
LIHDRDSRYGANFDRRVRGLRIRQVRTPFRSPRVNAVAERRVRSARSECLDHLIVFSEANLRRVLSAHDRCRPTDAPMTPRFISSLLNSLLGALALDNENWRWLRVLLHNLCKIAPSPAQNEGGGRWRPDAGPVRAVGLNAIVTRRVGLMLTRAILGTTAPWLASF